jgi:hypothetical protein
VSTGGSIIERMTPEMVIVGLYRIVGSLIVLRWPFWGAFIAIGVDLTDLLLFDLLAGGPAPAYYQSFDKWADQVYLLAFLIVAVRDFRPLEKYVAVALYLLRLVGFVAFELGAPREILFVFPNVFEFWVIAVIVLMRFRPAFALTPGRAASLLVVLTVAKLVQEWALHIGRLFDSITFVDALKGIWQAITGGG